MTARLLRLVCALAALPWAALAQRPRACTAASQAMRAEVGEVQKAQRNVGVATYVLHHDRPVLDLSLGYADLEDSTRVSPRTRFGVASITKAFTGVALLKLVDDGVIDVDQPIQRYVPTFPEKPQGRITLRMLAAHLGGIRHWASERGPALYARHFTDVDSILPLFASDTLVIAPATRYSYSSYGYNLLASAMQHAAGTPYQEIVRSRILAPLGLSSTAFDDVRLVMPYRARRYSYYDVTTFDSLAAPQRVPDWDYSHNMAGGNIVATAADLARFARVVTRPGFLSPASLRMLRTAPSIGTATSPMGFGWFVRPASDSLPLRLSINGSNAGLQAALLSYPDDDLVVVVLTNTWGMGSRSGDFASGLPERIARRCLAAR
jgi:CubicO group peptidase (beta-lactamase class C family)